MAASDIAEFYTPSVHTTPKEERIGGLRDRLHIFPYTYYLVGRPGPIVRRLLGIVVGITLLVLPLATLLVLQLRFLAYQDQAVTWAQRVAVWLRRRPGDRPLAGDHGSER